MKHKIYLASSWKNTQILDRARNVLRGAGHDVYDFREDQAFHWSDVSPDIQRGAGSVADTDAHDFVNYLQTPICAAGFKRDMFHLNEAEILVLLLPCGKSAHLELGYAIGKGTPTAVLLTEKVQPELMYKAADLVTPSLEEILLWTT